MLLFSLILATAQPDTRMLLSCDDFSWLMQGVVEAKTLSPGEKIEFIARFMQGTDPKCFEDN